MVFVLDKLIEIIMGKLVDAGIKKIASILEVESEMEALQRNMMNIRLVLVDAESKKIESNSINLWLAELREVLYDAEDLLDDFAVALEHSTCKVTLRNFFKYFQMKEAYEASTTIGNINNNLSRITSQTSILQLLATLPNAEKKVSRYNSSRITDTCSFQLDSEILGIDGDATDLVDRITGVSNRAHSLFAITGMGGIGKTTLARKVFNHDQIQNHFDNTVWVCVSSNRSGEDLLKEILRCFDEKYSETHLTLNELSSKVIKVVKKKKAFIVLDDIWDSHVWEKFLRVPLYAAEERSRILITTRNQQVAMKMNAAHTHRMTEMNISDRWSMLCKIVFEENDNGDMNELADVGREIVDKCKGLPLAIKVVGGVLRMTDRTIPAWRKVLSSTTWSMQNLPEDIPRSLLLSYEDLPSHLKRCFIYCSLFPQDFEFLEAILPYVWIAEGFIQKEEGTRMEESAKEYYNELVMRNLLQVTHDSNGNSKCKMHDLLHSLAIFVSQNQYVYVDPKTFIGSSGLIRHRHLWLNVENMNGVSKKIIGQQYVRTLMLSTNTEIELLSGLRRLRVLDIEGKSLQTLPAYYVRNMTQLRFLNISSSEFNSLPVSIENLKNLETLIVSVLKSRSLPEGICKLDNLRHLLVSDRLQNMPNGLDNLKKLRVLDCFVVTKCTSSTRRLQNKLGMKKSEDYKTNMKELKDLSQLTDLSIHNLERVVSKEEAQEAAIEKKTSLKCLKLHCSPPLISDEDIKKIEEVIKKMKVRCAGIEIPEKLTELSGDRCTDEKKQLPKLEKSLKSLGLHCQPLLIMKIQEVIKKIEKVFAGIEIPENLTELSIDGFFGKQLPAHMGWSRLHQVKSLKLERCETLEQLPSLGNMPKLETLHIKYLSVANFGSDFVGRLKFPKLQDFRLMEMEELVNMFEVDEEAFPCLVNLLISGCPKLKSLGEGLQHATCLKKMTVRGASKLESIENLNSISELKITRNSSLRSVKKLPSLKKMDIEKCSALKVIEDVGERSSRRLIFSDEERKHQATWSTNANASEIGRPTVTDSEPIVSTEENGKLASEHDQVKRKRVKVDSNDSMDVDSTYSR